MLQPTAQANHLSNKEVLAYSQYISTKSEQPLIMGGLFFAFQAKRQETGGYKLTRFNVHGNISPRTCYAIENQMNQARKTLVFAKTEFDNTNKPEKQIRQGHNNTLRLNEFTLVAKQSHQGYASLSNQICKNKSVNIIQTFEMLQNTRKWPELTLRSTGHLIKTKHN